MRRISNRPVSYMKTRSVIIWEKKVARPLHSMICKLLQPWLQRRHFTLDVTMKRLLTLAILMVCSLCMAQVGSANVFNYAVPLPATSGVSYVQWHYQIEAAFQDGAPGTFTLFQYDRRGRLFASQQVSLAANEVFVWDSAVDIDNLRVRSVALQADRPMVGTVVADHLEQLMASSLVASQASEIAIPYIPELSRTGFYDQMTLNLSVFGAASSGASADLDFTLIDNLGIERASQRLRDGLTTNGAVPVTPYFSLVLDGLESQVTPAWARVHANAADFELTSNQAYALKLDADSVFEAAAASESENSPVTQGQLLFTDLNRNDDGWVVLTNPHQVAVNVDLQMLYLPEFSDEQQKFLDLLNPDGAVVFSAQESLELAPLERRLVRLGEDLFVDVPGVWHRMSFTSTRLQPVAFTEEETEPEALGIYAMSFFNDGAFGFTSALFSGMGNTIDTWIRLDALQDKQLELATLGQQYWVPNVNASENADLVQEMLDPSAMFATTVPNGDLVSETTAVTIEIFAGEKLLNRSETVLKPGECFSGLNTENIRELFEKSGVEVFRIRVTGHSGAPLTAEEVMIGELDRATVKPHIYSREIPADFLTNGDTPLGDEAASTIGFKQ